LGRGTFTYIGGASMTFIQRGDQPEAEAFDDFWKERDVARITNTGIFLGLL